MDFQQRNCRIEDTGFFVLFFGFPLMKEKGVSWYMAQGPELHQAVFVDIHNTGKAYTYIHTYT